MKKLFYLFVFMLLPFCVRAQNPVQISQPYKFLKWISVKDSLISYQTIPQGDSSNLVPNTAWILRNLGAAVVPSNSITSGLLLNIYNDSTISVSPGTWRINNVNYSKGTLTFFIIPARDSIFSRYEVFYATTANQVSAVVGLLSPTPIEPSIPTNSIRIGSALITPTGVTLNQPSPSSNYVYSNPVVKQQAFPVVRTLTTDTLKIGTAYILPPIDGISGQVPQTDGNGHVGWANIVYTNGFGLLLNSNVFSVDTNVMSTIRGVVDTLNAHSAYLSDNFKVVNDTLYLADTIKKVNWVFEGGLILDDSLIAQNKQLWVKGSVTAASHLGRMNAFEGKLYATANGDLLINNDLNAAFDDNGFTGVYHVQSKSSGDIIPGVDTAYNLGHISATVGRHYQWKNVYTKRVISDYDLHLQSNTQQIYLDNLPDTATGYKSVVVNSSGKLQTAPYGGGGGHNIYNWSDSLTSDRRVSLKLSTLIFDGQSAADSLGLTLNHGGVFADTYNKDTHFESYFDLEPGFNNLHSADSVGNSSDLFIGANFGSPSYTLAVLQAVQNGGKAMKISLQTSHGADRGIVVENKVDSAGMRYSSYVDYSHPDSLTLMPKQWIEANFAPIGGGGGNTIYTASDSLTSNRQVKFVSHMLEFGDLDNYRAYFEIDPASIFSPNISGQIGFVAGSGSSGFGFYSGTVYMNHYNPSGAQSTISGANASGPYETMKFYTTDSLSNVLGFEFNGGSGIGTGVYSNNIGKKGLQYADTSSYSNQDSLTMPSLATVWRQIPTKRHVIYNPVHTGEVDTVYNNRYNIINGNSTLADLTLVMPSSPHNDDCVYIRVIPGSATIHYDNATFSADIQDNGCDSNTLFVFVYDEDTDTWY